ncbi:hypothetical protein DLM45_02395 [Hyphomicrobium methylovorum]|uniref:hypothetical protein n=1 Tax=Hyphomicrobium methylovorum TaxID=84 RepID=UPI0015E70A24|nr:hypothetical protein [Hyphomicrobium methylovorum]MBA2125076.1 hypothetical protein [Hyphomicrobium methylovorum]
MSNVVELNCETTLDIPAERILSKALGSELNTAIVVGYDKDGDLYFASTTADGGTVLWLFEQAKIALMGITNR